MISIDDLSATCVFKAFTIPKPFEKEVGWIFDVGEKFLLYRISACAVLKKRRSTGVNNLQNDNANLFMYVNYMLPSVFMRY